MLRIAGHDVSRMGLLSVALVCPSELQRKSLSSARGTHQIAGVWRGCMKDGTTKSAPSDSPDELQERDEAAPQFSLIDLREQEHTMAGDGESGFC